jgi:tetratricopeptide (TPR) repeat protein
MSEDSDDVELRIFIECDGGCGQNGKSRPLKRCAKCHCTFYCSVECQRNHWRREHRNDCRDISYMRQEQQKLDGALPQGRDATAVAVNTACGICLEEPIFNPVVLKQCRHAFCFPCLQSWQHYRPNPEAAAMEHVPGQGNRNKACPFCRQTIEKSATDEILELACLFSARARRLGSHDEERSQLFDAALAEVDKVLQLNANDLGALFVKGQILREVAPLQAVQVFQTAIDLDRQGATKRAQIDATLDAVKRAMDAGDEDEAERLLEPLEELYSSNDVSVRNRQPTQFGSGPYRLFPILLQLAEAHEAAGQWEEASSVYIDMLKQTMPDVPQPPPPQVRMIYFGLARCFYQLKLYERAIHAGRGALAMNRHFPGVHKLIALPQLALVQQQQQQTSGAGDQQSISGNDQGDDFIPPNMDDVLLTMRRGVVYETPWDDTNRQANRSYLQVLLEMANSKDASMQDT